MYINTLIIQLLFYDILFVMNEKPYT